MKYKLRLTAEKRILKNMLVSTKIFGVRLLKFYGSCDTSRQNS